MKLKKVVSSARRFLLLEVDKLEKLPNISFLFLGGALIFAVIYAVREWVVTDPGVKNDLYQILLNLIPEILGSALVYWVLDSSIQMLYGIAELPELPLTLFLQDIAQARQIRILETFTSLVTSKNSGKFYQVVNTAMRQQDASIQILMIHPDSDGAKQRTEELADILDVPYEIRQTLAHLYEMQESLAKLCHEGSFEVRLYDASPAIAMHQWDSNAYVSFYPVGRRADKAPNLKLSTKTTFGLFVTQKFEELWHGDSTIVLREHMLMTIVMPDGEERLTYAVQVSREPDIKFYASCNFGDKFGNFMKQHSLDREGFQVIADGKPGWATCERISDDDEKQIALEQLKSKYNWDDEQVNKEINLDPIVYLVQLVK